MTGKNFSCNNATGKRKKSDLYETPYSLTSLLLEKEKLPGTVLEPATGNGAIVKVLVEHGYTPHHFDLVVNDRDFLKYNTPWDTIITNPPFSIAQQFIIHAKKVARKKIVMLLPLSYLHGVERYRTIFQDKKFPLARVYVFTRYPMLGESLREDGKHETGMMVYAWFVWEKRWYNKPPEIHWLDNNPYIIGGKDR